LVIGGCTSSPLVLILYTEAKDLTVFSSKDECYLNTDFDFTFNNNEFFINNYTLYHPRTYYANSVSPLKDSIETSLDREVQNVNVAEHFSFLRQSTITSFFMVNMIDMPVCFKKSKSLYSKTFEIPLLKLSNILMRAGLRGKTIKTVTLSFTQCFHEVMGMVQKADFINWRFLYSYILSTRLFRGGFISNTTSNLEVGLDPQHRIKDGGYEFNSLYFLKTFLFEKLEKYAPLFSFYIRKVDKSVRKNSRGKSGKYTIIWKYVPVYKRLYVNIRWLLRDLKFQKFKTFTERLTKVLETFLLTPHLSFVCKLRRFTHFFVFKNYKKSLLKTLKSTS
jgi:hypothetical protein